MKKSEEFDTLRRLEQLKINGNSITKRTADILYRDRYENVVSDMREDWKQFDVDLSGMLPRRRKEPEENEKDDVLSISINNARGDNDSGRKG